jgi:hypothetical protein
LKQEKESLKNSLENENKPFWDFEKWNSPKKITSDRENNG